jgi:hypothetical protein
MKRFWMAMGVYSVLAIVAWTQLTAPIPETQSAARTFGLRYFEVRHVVLVILAALALSTWMHRRDREVGSEDSGDGNR